MRVKVDWRAVSKDNYQKFCDKYPNIHISFIDWMNVIYSFNEGFRDYMLETGERVRMPSGFGEFAVNKRRRNKTKTHNGVEYVNLPIDWVKTKEKGKKIYQMNYHSEGYFFGWQWFKDTARIKFTDLWYFKPLRATSRILAHYIKVSDKYQHIYKEWKH